MLAAIAAVTKAVAAKRQRDAVVAEQTIAVIRNVATTLQKRRERRCSNRFERACR